MKAARHGRERQIESTTKPIMLRAYKPRADKRSCNLCEKTFEARSKYERFCDVCKKQSELYHFSEWLCA